MYVVEDGEQGVYIQKIDLISREIVNEGEYDSVDDIKNDFPDFPISGLDVSSYPFTVHLENLPSGFGAFFRQVNFSIDGQNFTIWEGENTNIPQVQVVGSGVIAPSFEVNYGSNGPSVDFRGVLVVGGCSTAGNEENAENEAQSGSQNGSQNQGQNSGPIVVQLNSEQLGSVVRATLEEVLNERNSDLVRVIKDCPYIPIRSLNGTQGSIYGDGENITLSKLGKTFKVVGSFHIVRDTDLNLTTAYALALSSNVEPSLILPEPVLKQLQGA